MTINDSHYSDEFYYVRSLRASGKSTVTFLNWPMNAAVVD